jgi:hypothetical protein
MSSLRSARIPAKFVLSLLAFSVLFPVLSYAWGAKGHEIVGYIAEDHLTEAAREKIKAFLKNETLVQAATWPDKIRKAIPGRPASLRVDLEKGSARALAKRLDQQFSADERKSWEVGTPKEWADESLAITTVYVYPLPENHEISEEYAKRGAARVVAESGAQVAMNIGDIIIWESMNLLLLIPVVLGLVMLDGIGSEAGVVYSTRSEKGRRGITRGENKQGGK